MKLAVALVVAAACSSSAKPHDMTTSTSAAMPGSQPATAMAAHPSAASTTGKAPYSCFSYVSTNSTQKRHACMRSDDCGPYLEQARSVGGIRELSGCANAPTVYCFRRAATQDEADGLDVCQPTLDECKAARADVVRAKMAVDSECAQP